MDDTQYEMLRKANRKGKMVTGEVSYDIYNQHEYQDQMFYLPIDTRLENDESDLMIQVLTLGE